MSDSLEKAIIKLQVEVEKAKARVRIKDDLLKQAIDALRSLHNALKPFREQGFHGSTYCKFCGANQGEWVKYDPYWVPTHREECPIGKAIKVLREYPPK